MFVSLVKINKYLIYLFLFLFFNCIHIGPIIAADTSYDNIYYDVPTGKAQYIRGITFNNDGTKMFITGGKVAQFTLSTGFDLSSVTYVRTLSISINSGGDPRSLIFSPDGTTMLILDS